MSSNVSLITNQLYQQVKRDIQSSTTIYILSSFMMYSGVKLILKDLEEAVERGADIKVLTGDYLYVTQPKAIKKLLTLNRVELRLWQSNGRSFHPKSYIFKHKEDGAIVIGSSNLSKSALTSGVEWNLRMVRNAENELFENAIDEFIQLFYADQTMQMNKETLKIYEENYREFHNEHPDFSQTLSEDEEIELTFPNTNDNIEPILVKDDQTEYEVIEPRPAQKKALKQLELTIEEDYNKAMVVMATGLGKTYLAAFFAQKFQKVLFIAHREEILNQAKKSFEKVLQIEGGIYNGKIKEANKELLFASIFTLSIQDHLQKFRPDEFDLIIIDEFHHAAANSYTKVIDYFSPSFLLGLTATPERTDGKDIFALCDGNVAYEIHFIEAIRHGWLSPFKYFGVKDDIDYTQIKWLGRKYDPDDLLAAQLISDRAKNVYEKWHEHKQTKTLAFCSSIQQAEYLENYFKDMGVKAITLTSKTVDITREEAIVQLEKNKVDIIFTVDLFNEGVDIPAVDTLLFTRPTESLVVFTQQIGRGLRKHPLKDQCVIIDLIGNYRNANTKFQVFHSTEGVSTKDPVKQITPELPADCEINLETEVVDLLKELKRKRSSRKDRVYYDYLAIKERLGRRPYYKEMFLYGEVPFKEYKQVFGGYFPFLNEYGELTEKEIEAYEEYGIWFKKLEKESMAKSYKMVVLSYMLSKGPNNWYKSITPEEVAPFFHDFYMSKTYRKNKDFSDKTTKKLWKYNESEIAKLIARMPMSKLVDNYNLVYFNGSEFGLTFDILPDIKVDLYRMTSEICNARLHFYFKRNPN